MTAAVQPTPGTKEHHAWVAALVNGLLETGVLIITGGRVQLGGDGPGTVETKSNPIEQ